MKEAALWSAVQFQRSIKLQIDGAVEIMENGSDQLHPPSGRWAMKSKSPIPRIGPYYWLYLRPAWQLHTCPTADGEVGHPAFWRRLSEQVIAPHYGITSSRKIEMLATLCYSMPRGRCAQPIPLRLKVQRRWIVYHGDDTPSKVKNWQSKILREFTLVSEDNAGNVTFAFDDHETTQRDDTHRLQNLIGPVIS